MPHDLTKIHCKTILEVKTLAHDELREFLQAVYPDEELVVKASKLEETRIKWLAEQKEEYRDRIDLYAELLAMPVEKCFQYWGYRIKNHQAYFTEGDFSTEKLFPTPPELTLNQKLLHNLATIGTPEIYNSKRTEFYTAQPELSGLGFARFRLGNYFPGPALFIIRISTKFPNLIFKLETVAESIQFRAKVQIQNGVMEDLEL